MRYRGYYYDAESGFYYLQSRYYDPALGRFINADSYASTGQGFLGYNMFAYCHNNTVANADFDGHSCVCVAITDGGGRNTKKHRDVTDEVDTALKDAMWGGFIANRLCGGSDSIFYISKLITFRKLVDHGAEWDIKREKVWEKTIGTTFPGENEVVIYHGIELTPENLGNVTYGILGRSYGIDLYTLLAGSYVAAGLPKEGPGLENELTVDQPCVYIGYDALFPIIYEKYYGG